MNTATFDYSAMTGLLRSLRADAKKLRWNTIFQNRKGKHYVTFDWSENHDTLGESRIRWSKILITKYFPYSQIASMGAYSGATYRINP